MRVAAIDKKVFTALTEQGIGLKLGKRDWIMDAGLNSAGIQVGRQFVTLLGTHDKQVINLPRPILAYRKGQRGNTLQTVEVTIGDPDPVFGPAIEMRQLGVEDRCLESIKPRVGDRVRFGAAIASIRMDVERGEWLVGLEPDSGVILTHEKALEALGLSATDELAGEDRP